MKRLLILIVGVSTLLLGVPNAGVFVVNSNYDYDETKTKTYKTNYCYRGFKSLKKYLENRAKDRCAKEEGVHSLHMLKFKEFTKLKCKKIKKRHHRTKVQVTARFKAMCNR